MEPLGSQSNDNQSRQAVPAPTGSGWHGCLHEIPRSGSQRETPFLGLEVQVRAKAVCLIEILDL